MPGTGTLINAVLVICGSLAGLFLKKSIPERLKTSMVQALALATITIGLTGIITASCTLKDGGGLTSSHTIVMVISMALGTFFGELINIDKKLDDMGAFFQKKFSAGGDSSFAEGFVTASLVFCVGSMAILGALNDGLYGDFTILLTKSLLDAVMSVVFASTLGMGVLFSAVTVIVYQGLITLCASLISPFLTQAVIAQMSFIGSILIMGIGLNFLYKPAIRLANMLPAMFLPLIYYIFQNLIGRIF